MVEETHSCFCCRVRRKEIATPIRVLPPRYDILNSGISNVSYDEDDWLGRLLDRSSVSKPF